MNGDRLAVTLGTLAGAVIIALAFALQPVGAQSPVGGALATLAAATAQADQWQANQRAAQATRAAASFEATQSAAATRQAVDLQATQSAQAELDRQRAAMATSEAMSIQATAQAVNAIATRNAQDAQAEATRQAVDLSATRAAYDAQRVAMQERVTVGTRLLYLSGSLALVGCAYVVWTWARAMGGKVARPEQVMGDVVDVTPILMLPAGPATPPNVRTVNDPRIIEAIGNWFYSDGSGDNE